MKHKEVMIGKERKTDAMKAKKEYKKREGQEKIKTKWLEWRQGKGSKGKKKLKRREREGTKETQ